MTTLKVKQLANKKGLNILEDSIEINESGVDFQVAHVTEQNGDKWILRIPRRPEIHETCPTRKRSVRNYEKTCSIPSS